MVGLRIQALCKVWLPGLGQKLSSKQACFRSIWAKLKGDLVQDLTKASLFTRPMMTMVGICPVNRASTSAMMAPAAKVKCLMTTWASGYLALDVVRTFSWRSCPEVATLTLSISRTAASIRTWYDDFPLKSMRWNAGRLYESTNRTFTLLGSSRSCKSMSECRRPLKSKGWLFKILIRQFNKPVLSWALHLPCSFVHQPSRWFNSLASRP